MVIRKIVNRVIERKSAYINAVKEYKNSVKRVVSSTDEPKLEKSQKFKVMFNFIKSKRVHMTKAQVKELSKLSLQDFIAKGVSIIAKAKNIPQELMSPVVAKPLPKKVLLFYDASNNVTYINNTIKHKPGAKLFAALSHETEHTLQNYKILRTEILGEKAVQKYAEVQSKNTVEIIKTAYGGPNVNIEQYREQLGEESFAFLKSFKAAEAQGGEVYENWLKTIQENEYKSVYDSYSKLRQKVIDYYGVIKSGTKQANISKEYFNAFISQADKTKTESIINLAELEAYFTTYLNSLEYRLTKLFGK